MESEVKPAAPSKCLQTKTPPMEAGTNFAWVDLQKDGSAQTSSDLFGRATSRSASTASRCLSRPRASLSPSFSARPGFRSTGPLGFVPSLDLGSMLKLEETHRCLPKVAQFAWSKRSINLIQQSRVQSPKCHYPTPAVRGDELGCSGAPFPGQAQFAPAPSSVLAASTPLGSCRSGPGRPRGRAQRDETHDTVI